MISGFRNPDIQDSRMAHLTKRKVRLSICILSYSKERNGEKCIRNQRKVKINLRLYVFIYYFVVLLTIKNTHYGLQRQYKAAL